MAARNWFENVSVAAAVSIICWVAERTTSMRVVTPRFFAF